MRLGSHDLILGATPPKAGFQEPVNGVLAARPFAVPPAMNLLTRLIDLFRPRDFAQHVREVARRCYAPLRDAAEWRLPEMVEPEAFGYLLARSRPFVRVALAETHRRNPNLRPAALDLIALSARELVAHEVLADVRAERQTPRLRRAA